MRDAGSVRYEKLATEQPNAASRDLDRLSPLQITTLMNREDRRAVAAVGRAAPRIAAAVDLIVTSMASGGRLIFVGAGTSGRLGVLEAAECPPTFNTAPSLVQGVMAGGRASVFRSREGAEDDAGAAVREIRARVRRGDVVVGVSASGVTPFVRAALRTARAHRAHTVLVACSGAAPPAARADVVIALAPGPEVLTGSTRLKAGTATKLVLNTLTMASMARLGKVYGNRMVDVQPRSRKLRARARALVRDLAGVPPEQASRALASAGGNVRLAIVMARGRLDRAEALQRLASAGGSLREALAKSTDRRARSTPS